MKMTIAEIALFLGGTVIGADDTIINDIRSIEEANEGDLTFIANKKYLKKLKLTKGISYSCPSANSGGRQKFNYCGRPLRRFGEIINTFLSIGTWP